MSWKATAWAKDTRGHKGYGDKLLLMILADYHDTERGFAWPSQKTLGLDCEMPLRTVRHCMSNLEASGFITVLQKGNQYQPSHYQLNFATTQGYEEAGGGAAMVASTHEGAISNMVKGQYGASEAATPRITNLQEPPLEPPLSPEGEEVWPDWYSTLYAIPGFKISFEHAKEWLAAKNITEELAETTAYALKGKWPGPKSSPYRDAWAVFQNWVKSPQRSNNGTARTDTREADGSSGTHPRPTKSTAFAKYTGRTFKPTGPGGETAP